MDLEVGYLAVSRQVGVHFGNRRVDGICEGGRRSRNGSGRSRLIGLLFFIDKGDEFAVTTDDKGLVDGGLAVEERFDFFGVDVLTGRTENHRFAASAEEDKTILVHRSEVTRPHPAIGRKSGSCSFWVLVVTDHAVVALQQDLAGHMQRVWRVDSYLHSVHESSAAVRFELLPRRIADQRRALGHAVARQVRKTDVHEAFLHLGIDSRSAGDEAV